MDVQGNNLAIEVMKWVGIVLAAGFIGYFGRYLAMLIIGRIHKKKVLQAPPAEPAKEVAATQESNPKVIELEIEEQKAKLEKKKAKAEAKRLKKEQKK
ncbi:hypothetical protein ACFLW4_01035 [Chloroflexota bacterium]